MFYTLNQNNSGGYFIENDNVGRYVIIEANTPNQAEEIGNKIVDNYREYCKCCGERWDVRLDDSDGYLEPSIWGESINKNVRYCEGSCIIYYLDGRKEMIK